MPRFLAAALVGVWLLWGCGPLASRTAASTEVATETFISGESYPVRVPVFSSLPLEERAPDARVVVIAIPSRARDGRALLQLLTQLVQGKVPSEQAIVVVPQFPLAGLASRAHLGPDYGVWQSPGWWQGDRSLPDTNVPIGVSSYRVVDDLVAHYLNRYRYPHVRAIAVAGFTQGGDFVQRYAVLNPVEARVRKAGVQLRYVVASPSSYLYVSPDRPQPGSGLFTRFPIAECPGFDRYPYGVEGRNSYARQLGRDQVKVNAGVRAVRYLVVASEGTSAKPVLDTSCAARAQGGTRHERAADYLRYLQVTFGRRQPSVLRIVTVPEETEGTVFGSACGLGAMLGSTFRC